MFVVHRLALRREGDGYPQLVAVRGVVEPGGHDADDVVGPFVERDATADDTRIAAEPPHPEAMTQHDDLFSPGLIFFFREDSALRRRQVEDVEVSGRDSSANHALRVPAVSEVEAGELRCADGAEGADRLDAVDEVASRDVAPILAHVLVDRQQSIRIRKGKGPEDDRLHGAEDGRCGADAEREREHCDGREARASGKLPAGKLHVLS